GLAEYKCPKKETHLGYLWADVVPKDYEPQMMWQMACDPGRKWNDFVSHYPKLPPKYRTFIKRLRRDDVRIADMEAKVKTFLAEVAEIEESLRERFEGGPSPTERKLRQSIAHVKARKNGRPQLVVSALDEELMIGEEENRI